MRPAIGYRERVTEIDAHGTDGSAAESALAELDAAAAELDGASELTLAEAADRLDAVHAKLQAALADLDRA